MKIAKKFLPILLLFLVSCSAVRVRTDYDTTTDFNNFKTFAFYKTGIDKATVSDIDKKRIMRAIETELLAKGMTKSKTPDMLVSLFTKSRKRINVNDTNFGGFYYPFYYRTNPVYVSQYTEGTLFIDLIDANKKELVWQGVGTGTLSTRTPQQKEARIKTFVNEILGNYPPGNNK